MGHATRGGKASESLEDLHCDCNRESIPKSSEEQEVGMVGFRTQDMATEVGREWRAKGVECAGCVELEDR